MQTFVASVNGHVEPAGPNGSPQQVNATPEVPRGSQLGALLASETDTQKLLDSIVREAAAETRASSAALILIIPGEQGLEVRAEWNGDAPARPRCLLQRAGATRQALVTGKPVVTSGQIVTREDGSVLLAEGGHTQISVPLVYQDLILGVLNTHCPAIDDATAAAHSEILQTLAGYAATALYIDRLKREQHDSRTALRDLQRHSAALLSRAPENRILEDATRVLSGLLETNMVAVFLHDPDTVGLRLCATEGGESQVLEALADALHPGAIPAGYHNGTLFIDDIRTSNKLPALVRTMAQEAGIYSVLSFAVGNEQQAGLGMVLTAFPERPSLLAHQIDLAQLYASQVSVAVHTLRLSEQAAQTAREQAAIFAITQALHNGGEAEELGQRVLDTLAMALRASGGCLLMGDLFDTGGGGRTLNGLQLVQTGTPHDQIEYYVALVASGLTDDLEPFVDGEGWEAVFARLETRFGLAGMLSLWRQSGSTDFTAREQELIQTVSNELARHLENRALIARDLAALSEVAPAAGAAQIADLAARTAERVKSLAHSDGAAILLFDDGDDSYHMEAELGDLPDLRWAEDRANLQFLSSLRDPQMMFAGDYRHLGGERDAAEEADTQHLLLVPLCHDDVAVGLIICGYSDPVHYRSRLPFIGAMAQRAAMVLRNLQLQVDAEQLTMLEERNRIARTMHDGLAQGLAQIRFRTELIRKVMRDDPERASRELDNVQQALKKSIGGIRRTINSLEPVTLKKLGLYTALMRLGEGLSEDSANQIAMSVQIDVPIRSLQAQLAVFRLTQEALSSAMNLHEEGECRCDVHIGPEEVCVTVSHNGEPRVDEVADIIREQLLALIKSRGGLVDVAANDGRLTVTASMRLWGDGVLR